jgi:peptide deformylase
MTVRNITMWPNKILATSTAPIPEAAIDSHPVQSIIEDLIDTCSTVGGFGLAAPQIGKGLRAAVINLDNVLPDKEDGQGSMGWLIMLNPVISNEKGESKMEEGCLSMPRQSAFVPRAESLTLEYTDRDGNQHTLEAEGLLATVIAHEMDHLDGKVFADRLSRFQRTRLRERMMKLKKKLQKVGYASLPVPGAVVESV